MKNFKLLLATTAILSTGLAMGANAGELTATINPKVRIIATESLLEIVPLHFGVLRNVQTGGTVTIDTDGNATINDKIAQHMGGAQRGVIRAGHSSDEVGVFSNMTATVVEDFDLLYNGKKCGTFSDFSIAKKTLSVAEAANDTLLIDGDYMLAYGGKFTVDIGEGIDYGVDDVNFECTGQGTITFLYNVNNL